MARKPLNNDKNFRSQLRTIRSRYSDVQPFATAYPYAGKIRGSLLILGEGRRVARVMKFRGDDYIVQTGRIPNSRTEETRDIQWNAGRVHNYKSMDTAVRQGVKLVRGTF